MGLLSRKPTSNEPDKSEPGTATCVKCNRRVRRYDLDADGVCRQCRPEKNRYMMASSDGDWNAE